MTNLIDFLGRLLISALFLISAYNKIFSIDGTMSWMEGFGVPGFLFVVVNGTKDWSVDREKKYVRL